MNFLYDQTANLIRRIYVAEVLSASISFIAPDKHKATAIARIW